MLTGVVFLNIKEIYLGLKIILFFLFGGYVLYGALSHRLPATNRTSSILILFLLMVGLSPYVATLVLYYSLLLFPHRSDIFYLLMIVLVYLAIYVFLHKTECNKDLLVLIRNLLRKENNYILLTIVIILLLTLPQWALFLTFRDIWYLFKVYWMYISGLLLVILTYFMGDMYLSKRGEAWNLSEVFKYVHKRSNLIVRSIIIILFTIFLLSWLYYTSTKIWYEHDKFEYAVQGKIFYEQKIIHYDLHRYDKNSGFYYVGLHGFSYLLLSTLERMTNSILDSGDYFFRSIDYIYGILVLLIFFIYSYEKTNLAYAFIITLSLLYTIGFFEILTRYYIDDFKIFFIISTIYLLVYCFTYLKDKNCLNIFALFLGAQSNAHSIGFILAGILLFSLFLFLPFTFKERIKIVFYLFILMIFYGGLHYLLDIIWGTRWVLDKEILY